MIRLAKNLREQIFQYVPSFAAEENASKIYKTIIDLEDDISQKKNIYPGKIVYVFETKKYYLIDLSIDGSVEFSPTITTEWINHLDTIKDNVDVVTSDYELPGYTNLWVYDELIKGDELNIPTTDGQTPISKNSEIQWVQSEIRYVGDLSTAGTTVANIDLLPIDTMKIFLTVKGTSLSGIGLYTSTIILSKDKDDEAQFSEYAILNKNDLDIEFDCFLDTINNKWVLTLTKTTADFTIQDTIIKLQLTNFL